jgi:hypothetical protein
MPRAGNSLPSDHTEFGGGSGLIDPVRRADRVIGTASGPLVDDRVGEELMEIYATNPADPTSEPSTAKLERP